MRTWESVGEMEKLDEKYITVEGFKIRYIVSGDGAPTLLIHGFGEFLEVWWFNINPLSEHCQVYAVDLPGHGLSSKPAVDYSISFIHECIVNFMQAVGMEHANLIGHSMGGGIALSMAINFPDKVDKLILVDTAGLSTEASLLHRLCTLPVLGKIIMGPTIKAGLRYGMKKAFYNPNLLTEEMVNKIYEFQKIPGTKQAMLSLIRSNANISGPHPEKNTADKLHLIKSPTLLIHGAQDEVIPVEHAQNACQVIPNARLKVVDECGHCPHIEKAAEFNEAVIAFLKYNELRGGQSVG